jgi:hypothetical protein
MEKNVTVPLYLLDAILRLLDSFGDLDIMDFHKCGYNPRIEYENAEWELRIKMQQLQYHLLETYLLTIGDITDDESRALHEWVEAGNSVYCNPCLIYDDSGQPMDFINGYRLDAEMAEDLSTFFVGVPDDPDSGGWNDDLPF